MELARVGRSVAGDVDVGEILKTPCWRFWTLHFVARDWAAVAGRAVRGIRRRVNEKCGSIWNMDRLQR